LSHFNNSQNHLLVHGQLVPTSGPQTYRLRWLGSPAGLGASWGVRWYQVTANWRTKGSTSHRYHTTNSPTAQGRYWWMILMSLLAWNPLWAHAGAPPVRCMATTNFSLNRATCWKYFSSLVGLTAPWVRNARATGGSRAI
ncbi:hypothetical protein BDW68DRAFT_171763, partial [Aspergillus falconensis]